MPARVMFGQSESSLRDARKNMITALEKCPYVQAVTEATAQDDVSAETTLTRLARPVGTYLPTDTSVASQVDSFNKEFNNRCLGSLESMRDLGTYDYFSTHTLTWVSCLTPRMVESFMVDASSTGAKLELLGDASGRHPREAQFTGTPKYIVCDSPNGDCNLQVVKIIVCWHRSAKH